MTELEIKLLEALMHAAKSAFLTTSADDDDDIYPVAKSACLAVATVEGALVASEEGSLEFKVIVKAYNDAPTYKEGAEVIKRMLEELKDE